MIPLALPSVAGLSPVLLLRPSAAVITSLSLHVAAKAPCVAALAPRSSSGGGPRSSGIDDAGVSDVQRYDVRLRWVARRLRQRYHRHRSYAGVRALCSANDLLLAAVAVSVALRVAGVVAALAAAAAAAGA
jgi:hypothetical protein